MIALVNSNTLRIPLADKSVHMACCSPPYWGLRDYGLDEKGLGLEPTPEEFITNMVAVGREIWRVLRDDGTFWLNLGDSYSGGGGYYPDAPSNIAGSLQAKGNQNGKRNIKGQSRRGNTGLKPKDLCGIPWRVALALQADGWYLRSDIIWHKPNSMPESVTDRPTKAHEYVFLMTKRARYFYDADAIREEFIYPERTYNTNPEDHKTWQLRENGNRSTSGLHDGREQYGDPMRGRNRRTVWTIATQPYSGGHFATFPEALVEPCIKAGTSERGCCPVCGAQWERVTEPSPEYEKILQDGRNSIAWSSERRKVADKYGIALGEKGISAPAEYIITGFRSTCPHDADPVPCTVLDPFCGSGTTGVVARRLGRHFIGLDLSFDYLANQARTRLELDRLEAWQEGRAESVADDMSDLPLFASRDEDG